MTNEYPKVIKESLFHFHLIHELSSLSQGGGGSVALYEDLNSYNLERNKYALKFDKINGSEKPSSRNVLYECLIMREYCDKIP